MECEVCGGTNFVKESGFFYCNECQTQSQEIREHEFQDDFVNVRTTRKIKTSNAKQCKEFTSWECYNKVLLSLSVGLIQLGANKELKKIVKCLWLKYLEKLEVLNTDYHVTPKLQLFNCKRDANILLGGRKRKRKRKRNSSTSDDQSFTASQKSSSVKRRLTKKKTALIKSEYEASQQLTQDSSLHNETLSGLKGESGNTIELENTVRYNRYSILEMKKIMSITHCYKHKTYNENLKCHRNNHSEKYKFEVFCLTPIKVYSILYLGLLIIQDKIQLGDLLRFIKEGRLSFNKYTNLFPEQDREVFLNIMNNNICATLTSTAIRKCTAKMATFLNAVSYISVPDCMELCRRYCKELNLPDGIANAVENIMTKTVPKMSVGKDRIPNYEGRVMSLIIFVLKLLFGLDGVTEFEYSKYSKLVRNNFELNTFDVISWVYYLVYRKLVITRNHFPSYHEKSSDLDSDLFLNYALSQEIPIHSTPTLTNEMKQIEEILLKIKDLQEFESKNIIPVTLTPFSTYIDLFSEAPVTNIASHIIKRTFKNDEIDFILRPSLYFNLSNRKVVKHGGANERWVFHKIKNYSKVKMNRQYKKLMPLEIIDDGEEVLVSFNESITSPRNVLNFQMNYEKYRNHIFNKNFQYMEKMCRHAEHVDRRIVIKSYYNPFERYWLNLLLNNNKSTNNDEFNIFYENHSITFKTIFDECSRIIEQTNRELFKEFQRTELFLTYSSSLWRIDTIRSKMNLDNHLKYHILQAKEYW